MPVPPADAPGSQPPRLVSFYVRRDCHLCELAREELERVRRDVPFELEEIDVTGVPDLERRYGDWVPVVEVDGERLCVYRVEEATLRARLTVVSPVDWSA